MRRLAALAAAIAVIGGTIALAVPASAITQVVTTNDLSAGVAASVGVPAMSADGSHAVVAYCAGGVVAARAAIVDNHGASWGPEAVLTTACLGYPGPSVAMSADGLTVAVGAGDFASSAQVAIASVSGNVLSFGAPADVDPTSIDVGFGGGVLRLSANGSKIAFAYGTGSGGGVVTVGTVAGTNSSWATPQIFSASKGYGINLLVNSDYDTALVVYSDQSGASNASSRVVSFSGTSMTLGAAEVIDSSLSSYPGLNAVATPDLSTVVAIRRVQDPASSNYYRLVPYIGSVSGASQSWTTGPFFSPDTSDALGLFSDISHNIALSPDGSMILVAWPFNPRTSGTAVFAGLVGPTSINWGTPTAVPLPIPGTQTGSYAYNLVLSDSGAAAMTLLAEQGSGVGAYFQMGQIGFGSSWDTPVLLSDTATSSNWGDASMVANADLTRVVISWDEATSSGSHGGFNTVMGQARVLATPDAPTGLSATASDASASISFTPGFEGSASITNYEYSLDGGSWTAFGPSVTSSPVSITGLTNGHQYSVRLRAVNLFGSGDASTAVLVTPQAAGSAPVAPSVTQVVAKDGSATVSVAKGAGGDAAQRFIVTAQPGGATCTVVSATGGSCTISGLTNGREYTFTAIARNGFGDSSASAGAKGVPGAAPAPRPTPVPPLQPGESVATEGGVPITVDVAPNPSESGIVLSGSGFEMNLDGLDRTGNPLNLGPDGVLILASDRSVQTSGSGFKPNSDVNLYLDPPVSPVRARGAVLVGTVHTDAKGSFSGVVALPSGVSVGTHTLQAVGISRANLPRALSLGVRVSGSPRPVRHLSTSAGAAGSVVLSWTTPNAAIPVTAYTVQQRLVGVSRWTLAAKVAAPSTRTTVSGLIPGCSYDLRVAAVNGAGASQWSNVRYAVPLAGRTVRGDLSCLVK